MEIPLGPAWRWAQRVIPFLNVLLINTALGFNTVLGQAPPSYLPVDFRSGELLVFPASGPLITIDAPQGLTPSFLPVGSSDGMTIYGQDPPARGLIKIEFRPSRQSIVPGSAALDRIFNVTLSQSPGKLFVSAQRIVDGEPQCGDFEIQPANAVAPWLQVSRDGFDLFLYLPIGWTLSFFLAVLVQRFFPGATASGRRVWMLPVFLLALAFCWDVAQFSISFAFTEFFYPGPGGESQLVFVLMTCPTVAAIAYSLGMIWSTGRQASKAPATRNSGPDDASGVTLSSSL